MFQFLPLVALPFLGAALMRSLKGGDLSIYDIEHDVDFTADPDSPALAKVNAFLLKNFEIPATSKGGEPPMSKRKRFDEMGKSRNFPSTFTPLQIDQISGEWVTRADSDPDRRLLYLHGGAYTVGSAMSHRAITSKLAQATGASICAINYRLMPENTRINGIEDCRTAYKWLLENGPNGPAPMRSIAVGGDSAGGNLTLHLINWTRDQGLTPVNAAFALSPQTDSTLITPGIDENIATDHMLRPMIKPLVKLPLSVILLMTWKIMGFKPSAPEISPVRANLGGLPPTLIQASRQEMLYYDALRYYNKSRQAGNEVELQVWEHMPHVWHIFDDILPESEVAMGEIVKFLHKYGF